jgi:uncharacterized membrane protein
MHDLERSINRLVLFVIRHWLALANLAASVILVLGFLAPVLMLRGQTGAGNLLYLVFRPSCHQLPERSFFLGGPRVVYSFAQLSEHLGFEAPARFVGDPQLGYKIVYCERCAATYLGWLLAGVLFALFRRRVRQMPWPVLVLLILPIAVDGTLQLFGILESDWLRRVVTGLLFGGGIVWFAFPLVETGMNEALAITQRSLEEIDAAHG